MDRLQDLPYLEYNDTSSELYNGPLRNNDANQRPQPQVEAREVHRQFQPIMPFDQSSGDIFGYPMRNQPIYRQENSPLASDVSAVPGIPAEQALLVRDFNDFHTGLVMANYSSADTTNPHNAIWDDTAGSLTDVGRPQRNSYDLIDPNAMGLDMPFPVCEVEIFRDKADAFCS